MQRRNSAFKIMVCQLNADVSTTCHYTDDHQTSKWIACGRHDNLSVATD